MSIYEVDRDQRDDTGFAAGRLEHLVVGNRGRLLDARRTPVCVVGADPDRGSFVVEIEAFEDQGARWELGLEEIARFQFRREAQTAPPGVAAELWAACRRFDVDLTIEIDHVVAEATARQIASEQRHADDALAGAGLLAGLDLNPHVSSRRGHDALTAVVEQFLRQRDLLELDRQFARAFVTNPRAGEIVKGHAIVLAELGLCPYHGKVPRDPTLLDEPWSRQRRAQHLIARMAFARVLSRVLGLDRVTLYRAVAAEAPLTFPPAISFVSGTFSPAVAEAHFAGGPATIAAGMWRQRLPVHRLLMTFLETRALNERFREAEAILIGDPANAAF